MLRVQSLPAHARHKAMPSDSTIAPCPRGERGRLGCDCWQVRGRGGVRHRVSGGRRHRPAGATTRMSGGYSRVVSPRDPPTVRGRTRNAVATRSRRATGDRCRYLCRDDRIGPASRDGARCHGHVRLRRCVSIAPRAGRFCGSDLHGTRSIALDRRLVGLSRDGAAILLSPVVASFCSRVIRCRGLGRDGGVINNYFDPSLRNDRWPWRFIEQGWCT